MRASLQIEMEQSREERRAGRAPKFSINAVWLEGETPVGPLAPVQALAMIEEARARILTSVPFTPPEGKKIDVVGEDMLDQIKKKIHA